MLVHWIWFAHRPGLNDRDKMALLQHFRDPEDIYFADDGAFDAIGLSEDAKAALREKDLTSAEEILEACDREKLHILTCQDAAYPFGRRQYLLAVYRLDAGHTHQTHTDAFLREHGTGLFRVVADGSGEEYRNVAAVGHGDGSADPEIDGTFVDIALVFVAAAVIYRSVMFDHCVGRRLGLDAVAGDKHRHVGQRAHYRDILGGVMGDAERAV